MLRSGYPKRHRYKTAPLRRSDVDSNNVTLEILLKVEGVEGVGGVCIASILHSDGRARFVIQVDLLTLVYHVYAFLSTLHKKTAAHGRRFPIS